MGKLSRSNFAERLAEYPQVVLRDDQAVAARGNWRRRFAEAIGSTFGGRVVFEIGCFDASFLCRVATKHPQVGFVGVDWKARSLHQGAAAITAAGLRNVILIRGRGQDVAQFFAAEELDEIWLFHPDPCDKPAELNNRLFAEPFLSSAHGVLKRDASLLLKTDHPGYYQCALGLLGEPQPPWFAAAHDAHYCGASPPADGPRVRVKDLVNAGRIPVCCDSITQRYNVAANSADLWNDPTVHAQLAGRLFAGERTVFEQRFAAKRLPIYLIELRKRA